MQLGMIGLGRMGGNMTERCLQRGHDLVVYDHQAEAVARYIAQGAVGASSVEDLVSKLQPPRAIWLMLPAGAITEAAVTQLGELCSAGDIIIDGGNTMFKDDVRRAKALQPKGIRYVDVGTSGGVWGIERGYCLMIGGHRRRWRISIPSSKLWRLAAVISPARLDGNASPAQRKRATSTVAPLVLDIS